MEPMSALDASFLHLEDQNKPMHIGGVSIFEGPPPPFERLREMVAGKLGLVPRYRQKVRFVPLGLGAPVWVDDPHFNLDYHLRHTAVPPPGGDDQLRRMAARVFSQHLDRDKPLWEMWMVEGLSENPSSLTGPIGPHRVWSWATVRLTDVKAVRSELGGTVNDVVLAICTQGFRALLESRGEAVEDRTVRAMVPVSVRRPGERGAYNNRVSAVFAAL